MSLLYLINTAGEIIISIFTALVLAGLGYLLFRSWNKERIRIKQEKAIYIEGLKTKIDVQNDIATFISTYGTSATFCLLEIEINALNDVAAAFGEAEMEKILIKTAYKISDALPSSAELTRNKENSFIVFLKNVSDQSYIFELSKNIIDIIEQPIVIMGHANVELNSNIGMVLYPAHGNSYKELIKNLNLATYVAKKEGINTCSMYSDNTSKEQLGNLEYYQQILDGIKNNQFCLYYQPIMNAENNSVVAFEGLLRWNHPTLGVIPPNKFLNVIEQSGDIKFIGIWSFEVMVKQYFETVKNFPNTNIKYHLNLSPKQIIDENIVADISRILKKYKADPHNFNLEILEYGVYEKHPIVNLNIKKLRELGFSITTDNYGVDYNILNKIRTMPIDVIKLDKDFLVDDESSINPQLIELLMQLCKESNKDVIALGIENEEMLEKVREYGIKYIQGYYYSAPLSAEKAIEFIHEHQE